METDTTATSAESAWRSVWWRPQATIKSLISRGDRSHVLLLAALAGIGGTIAYLANMRSLHWFAVMAIALLLGPLIGILRLYIDAALVAWSGWLLGGRASQNDLRTALAWAWLPNVVALPLLLGSLAVFHQPMLRAYAGGDTDDPLLLSISLLLLAFVLWSIFLAIRGIGAVQGFGIIRSIANVAIPLLGLAAVALLIRSVLFQPFSIPAGSMKPALLIGDYAFADKLAYGLSRYSFPFGASFGGRILSAEPRRGDIAVFRLPSDPAVDYVKRIVGLPGDEVQLKGGVLYLNGTPAPREHIDTLSEKDCPPRDNCTIVNYARFRETLPEGVAYTVLDSEPRGPFDDTEVFKVPQGHYFVLGDNRDNSVDSRGMVGFVPHENLVGRMSVIFFSAGELTDTETVWTAFDNIRWSRFFQAVH